MTPEPDEKICATCGRPFAWRRKWADVWHEVRYCSRGCRGGPGPLDRELETVLLDLLRARAPGATCCPSEAARAVADDDWRPLMERTRRAARRLAHEGRVIWSQRGRTVDPGTARGPVRIGRGSRFGDAPAPPDQDPRRPH
jgi:hypothetical protein